MRKFTLYNLIFSMFLVSMGLIGCSKEDVTPREGAVEGRVLGLNGKPLANALVTWQYDNTRWGLTDEKGKYFVDGVGFGDQLFIVEANGYRGVTFQAPVYSGKTTNVNDVSIETLSFIYSDIKVDKTTATSVKITWKTSDFTNSIIEYGVTEALGQYFREAENLYTTTHSLEVPNLIPEKDYFFRISANRQGQQKERSNLMTFSTLNAKDDLTPPLPPANVETALNGIPGQAVVFWKPNSEADLKGYKVYRSEVANGSFTEANFGFIARGQERYTDRDVVPGKKYYYRVSAIDQANNESGFNNIAEILVPGNITSEVVWTVANSPYIVKGDINVTEFGKLRIDGGVKVLIDETDGLRSGATEEKIEFNIEGSLVASAGNYLPITFAANKTNPEKATWSGISFNNVSDVSNSMVNFKISDADTAISINNSSGNFSNIEFTNCNKAMDVQNTNNLTIDGLLTTRCSKGVELVNNKAVSLTNSTFLHTSNAIKSENNDGLSIRGCNMLEYTDVAILSNEKGGKVEFINNLFVSPTSLALQVDGKCQKIENSCFDAPYAIQIKSEQPIIQKNLFMAERSIFGTGEKCINYQGKINQPEFGPNNIKGFSEENAYIGCKPTIDSTSTDDIMLVKDISQEKYDYRLRQPYPNSSDPWGIIREINPYIK